MKIKTTLVSVIIWFVLGFIGTYIFSSKKKNHEGHYLPNIVIVKNVSSCNNTWLSYTSLDMDVDSNRFYYNC